MIKIVLSAAVVAIGLAAAPALAEDTKPAEATPVMHHHHHHHHHYHHRHHHHHEMKKMEEKKM